MTRKQHITSKWRQRLRESNLPQPEEIAEFVAAAREACQQTVSNRNFPVGLWLRGALDTLEQSVVHDPTKQTERLDLLWNEDRQS